MTQLIVTVDDLSSLPELKRAIKMLRGVKDITVCKTENLSDERVVTATIKYQGDKTVDCDLFGNCSGEEYGEMNEDERWMVREEQVSYQSEWTHNIVRKISQVELDAECITLEESKRKILDKIHRHFQGL